MTKKKIVRLPPKGTMNALGYLGDSAGCGHIRVILPFALINSMTYKKMTFNFSYLSNFVPAENFYKEYSWVTFQRSATRSMAETIHYMKHIVKPKSRFGLLYEVDDNLFDIPNSNYARPYYLKNRPWIEQILSKVDGMTVSTESLRKVYMKYNANISVIPNRLVKYLWGDIVDIDYENENPRILYCGSFNHFGQKEANQKGGDMSIEFINYIKRTTDKYQWVFVGGYPQEIKPEITSGKIEYHEWRNIFEFPRFIKGLKPDIGIAPLEKNRFNEGKSNLKMLEYAVLGIPGVYTNIEPYKNAEIKCNTDREMIQWIDDLAKDPDLRKEKWYADYLKVKDELWHEDHITDFINGHLKLFNKKLG